MCKNSFDSLQLFHIGLSWGGFESLILPVGQAYRTHTNLPKDGYLVRLNIGLESVVDLQKICNMPYIVQKNAC